MARWVSSDRIAPLTSSDYPNTGLNVAFATALSVIIADTKTFTVSSINFASLTEQGSTAQLIRLTPVIADDARMHDIERIPRSLIRESPALYGAATFAQYCLYREATPGLGNNAWSSLEYTAANPMPQGFADVRNARRDIPLQYQQDVFLSVSQKGSTYRCLL